MKLFSNKKSPDTMSILWHASLIKKGIVNNAQKYKNLWDTDIETQLLCDFVISFKKLLSTMPDSLAEFIPFFDPTKPYKGAMTGKIFSALNVPYIEPNGKGGTFVYKLIKNKKTTLIDGSQNYKNILQEINNNLQSKIDKIHAKRDSLIVYLTKEKEDLFPELQTHLNAAKLALSNSVEQSNYLLADNTFEVLIKDLQSQLDQLARKKEIYNRKLSKFGFIPEDSRKIAQEQLEQFVDSQINQFNEVLSELYNRENERMKFHRENNLSFFEALTELGTKTENVFPPENQLKHESSSEGKSVWRGKEMTNLEEVEKQLTFFSQKLSQITIEISEINKHAKLASYYETSTALASATLRKLEEKQIYLAERKNVLQKQLSKICAEDKLEKVIHCLDKDVLEKSLDEQQNAVIELANEQLTLEDKRTFFEGLLQQLHNEQLTISKNLINKFKGAFSSLSDIFSKLNNTPSFTTDEFPTIESRESALNWLEKFLRRWDTSRDGEKEYEKKSHGQENDLGDLILVRRCFVENPTKIPINKINELQVFKSKTSKTPFIKLLDLLHLDDKNLGKYSQKKITTPVLAFFTKERNDNFIKIRRDLLNALDEGIESINSSLNSHDQFTTGNAIFHDNKEILTQVNLYSKEAYSQYQSEQESLDIKKYELVDKIKEIERSFLSSTKSIEERREHVAALQKILGLLELNEKIREWKETNEKTLSGLSNLRSELNFWIANRENSDLYGHSIDNFQAKLTTVLEENEYDFFVSTIFPPLKEKISTIQTLGSENWEQRASLCDALDEAIQELSRLDTYTMIDNKNIQALFAHYSEKTESYIPNGLSKLKAISEHAFTSLLQTHNQVIKADNSTYSSIKLLRKQHARLDKIDKSLDLIGFYSFDEFFNKMKEFAQNITKSFNKRNENIALQASLTLEELTKFHHIGQSLLEHRGNLVIKIKENEKISHRNEIATQFNLELSDYIICRKNRYLIKDKILEMILSSV